MILTPFKFYSVLLHSNFDNSMLLLTSDMGAV